MQLHPFEIDHSLSHDCLNVRRTVNWRCMLLYINSAITCHTKHELEQLLGRTVKIAMISKIMRCMGRCMLCTACILMTVV